MITKGCISNPLLESKQKYLRSLCLLEVTRLPVSVERCQLELQSCYYFLPVQPELQRTTENYTDISLTRAADSRHWLSVTDSVTQSS